MQKTENILAKIHEHFVARVHGKKMWVMSNSYCRTCRSPLVWSPAGWHITCKCPIPIEELKQPFLPYDANFEGNKLVRAE